VDLTQRIDPSLLKKSFDIIVIGGGINGAAVARDAAERGMRVLLLEKSDFASGCTAHSTRLIHGGLRYLEHFEFDLVKESLHEREILFKSYPNLIHRLQLMIPVYEHSKLGMLKLKVGLTAYDFLSGKKSLKAYEAHSRNQVLAMDMGLNKHSLKGAVSYYDGQATFVERICLENVLSAEEMGAVCLNHCEVTEVQCALLEDSNFHQEYNGSNKLKKLKIGPKYQVQGVRFKDLMNAGIPYTATAKYVINMTGPAVDLLNTKLRQSENFYPTHTLPQRIKGTRGSHIVVESFKGAPKEFGIYAEAASDARPFFILPFRLGFNKDLYLIGTTDIFLSESEEQKPHELKITDNEIEYLLGETNALFPHAHLRREDVVKTFCGVRPLPYDPEANSAGAVTRKHFIHHHAKDDNGVINYYSILGGKITTFRNLAKEIVDKFTSVDCITDVQPTLGSEFGGKAFDEYLQEKMAE
jgi:glycerol-3-phosphate dehydrogenase